MKKLIVVILLFFIFANNAFATLGVGVGVGKIKVEEDLKPGVIYNLPSITVLNTGDEPSQYEVDIEHMEYQPELIPDTKWFKFSPATFSLLPGEVQEVKIKLDLPINTEPGDYFAFLEARPLKVTPEGTTSVNIAAATKLNFTVIPASILAGLYYKLISLWDVYAPIPQIVTTIILIGLSLILIKRFINIEVKMAKQNVPKWIIAFTAVIFFSIYFFFWVKFFEVL